MVFHRHNLSFDASTRTVSFYNADVGVHAVTVKATDGDGAFAEDTFNIVTNVNDKPVGTLDTTGGAAANAATFVNQRVWMLMTTRYLLLRVQVRVLKC